MVTGRTNGMVKSRLRYLTFNWTKFDILPGKFLEMWKNGYVKPDFLTSKYMDSAKAYLNG